MKAYSVHDQPKIDHVAGKTIYPMTIYPMTMYPGRSVQCDKSTLGHRLC